MSARSVIVACTVTVLLGLLGAGWLWEPHRLLVTRIDFRDGRLAEALSGRTVALLSDLHFDADGVPVATKALRELEVLQPDLILLAGDLVAWGGRGGAYEQALDFLAQLKAPLGVYAVMGDADRTFSRRSCEFCHRPGTGEPATVHRVVFLRDSERVIETGRGQVRIAGIETKRRRPLPDPQRRLLDGDAPAIVLSHSSATYGAASAEKDLLVLAGDTHGGQIRLPTWLWRIARLKPDPEHLYGLFREGRKTLFVTRGLGTSRLRFRLGVPPEIVLFTFGSAP